MTAVQNKYPVPGLPDNCGFAGVYMVHLSVKGNNSLSMWIGPSSPIRGQSLETNTVRNPPSSFVSRSKVGCALEEQATWLCHV